MLLRARRPISGDEGDPDDGRDKDRRELLGQDLTGALGDVCMSWTSCAIHENVVAERRMVVEGGLWWVSGREMPSSGANRFDSATEEELRAFHRL